jgi:O-antigen ligase
MRVTPRTLVSLGAVSLALGNLGRIPWGSLGGRSAPIVVSDLLLLPLWLTLVAVLGRRLRPVPRDGVTKWALAFIVVAAVSLAHASHLWGLGVTGIFGPAAYLLRWVLYAGWFWLVAVCFDADDGYAGVVIVERALLVMAAFGIVQSALLPRFAQLVPWGGADVQWDEQGRRLVSTLLDPNFAGILIVIALLLELAREAEELPARRGRLVTLGVAVLLTLSRSSLLALLVGVLVLIAARGVRRRFFGVLLAGGVVLVPFLGVLLRFAESFHKLGIDGSALQRFIPWTRAITMITDHPFLGVGFNAVPAAQAAYGFRAIGGADTGFDGGLLFVATMTGIPGLLLYVGMIVSALLICRSVWRRAGEPRARALAA